LIPMSSFAIEYFIPSLLTPPQSSFRRDYLFTNLSPSLFCSVAHSYHYLILSSIPILLQTIFSPHSFYEVSLRQLAQIYLVTIHPCDFLFLFYPFSSFRLRNFQRCFYIESLCTAWD
jgi:hypothetical protein